ncbi:MAG: 3'-5' exonuclease [Deltaproteobacteria bacterium]|nr:3'-5' exonuclease [Deltaproteobacteria bacterium]
MTDKASDFAAIDFETADYGRDSACSVAIIRVRGNKIVDKAHFLIRPPRSSFIFTYLHGITWRHVKKQPTFGELWPQIAAKMRGVKFIAAHNAGFDRSVLMKCCLSAQVMMPETRFECTVNLARQVWNIHPAKLPDVCAYLKIPLKHHDAVSDAEACARIVIAARQGR